MVTMFSLIAACITAATAGDSEGLGLQRRFLHPGRVQTRPLPNRTAVASDFCSFRIFRDGAFHQDEADDRSVEFKAGGVMVIRDNSMRVLVFLPGKDSKHPGGCHEQAEVTCKSEEGGAEEQKPHALVQATPGVTTRACAASAPCRPQDRPGLSYLRSMIGGSLQLRRREVKRIASIGLGAGSIPLWFGRHLPHAEVDSVDISADVLAAAPCFGLTESPMLRLIEMDGRSYIEKQALGSFDIIFVDAFDDKDQIPKCLRTVEFFEHIRARLSPGGTLVMNTWRKETRSVVITMAAAFQGQEVQVGQSPGLRNLIVRVRTPGGSAEEGDGVAGSASWADEAEFQVPTVKLEEPFRDHHAGCR